MKKIFYSLGIAFLAGAAMITGCDSPSQKIADAKEELATARENLQQAKDDSIDAHKAAQAAFTKQIEKNEQLLAGYKVKIAKENKVVRTEYQATIDKLEQKNADMKTMIASNEVSATDSWSDFKLNFIKASDEFNDEMTEFGKKWAALTHTN